MATLILQPNPVDAYSSFHGSGNGYTYGKPVNITVSGPEWSAGFPVPVNENGIISFMFWVDGEGDYFVKTMQNLKGKKQTVLASAILEVV